MASRFLFMVIEILWKYESWNIVLAWDYLCPNKENDYVKLKIFFCRLEEIIIIIIVHSMEYRSGMKQPPFNRIASAFCTSVID